MTNQELLQKMRIDMEMRGFSKYTKGTYETNGKKIMEYFKKPFEEVTTDELRDYLLKYLKQERGLSERSVNYYNSVNVNRKMYKFLNLFMYKILKKKITF